ncbi:uncharacterized protein TRIADDRAFT_54563 [Trichoplax adhaerens]|uniref:Uncharacterized protein n=1 Tax=Trichoplax adhaerens TaxID=10228 RepID=B3RSE0_TRIAD|nr:hypothetical protein TRIADDRAFT_54563 [Trichoplax adhaerens]EDV26499.1 hypothetical protein TRIADDRAFT_54563 [Trichoplax adhaerens]|eukprot:XP_002110495.1 hypothetical protein TRIADDRAFT_54563 [Trichoplax adhaerens]
MSVVCFIYELSVPYFILCSFVNERHHHIKLSLRDKDEKIGYVLLDSCDLQSRQKSKGRWYNIKSTKNNAVIIGKLYIHAYHVNPMNVSHSNEDKTNTKKSKLNIFNVKFRRSFSNLSKGPSSDLSTINDANQSNSANSIIRKPTQSTSTKSKNRRLSEPIAISARNNFAALSSSNNKGSDIESSTDSNTSNQSSSETTNDGSNHSPANHGSTKNNIMNVMSARLASTAIKNQNQLTSNGVINHISLEKNQQERVPHLRAASYIGDEKYPFTLHDEYWSATVEHYRRLVSDLQERIQELTDQNKILVGKYQDLCRECTTQLDYIQRLVNILMKVDPDELEKMMPC